MESYDSMDRTSSSGDKLRFSISHPHLCLLPGVVTVIYWGIVMKELTLTAVYEEAEEGGYIGYVAELLGANTQGETLEEVRENLTEAIQLVLEL